MTDVMTPEERSRTMAAINGKDTKPESIERKTLSNLYDLITRKADTTFNNIDEFEDLDIAAEPNMEYGKD